MPKKLILLLDVDGVIANFNQLYLDIVEHRLGKKFTVKDITEWDVGKALKLSDRELDEVHDELYAEGKAFHIVPYHGAIAAVNQLWQLYDLWFVTAPLKHSKTWDYDRRQWFLRYFGEAAAAKVIYAGRKERLSGDALVDDKLENIQEWQKANPEGISIYWSDNHQIQRGSIRGPRVITKSWDEVVAFPRLLDL